MDLLQATIPKNLELVLKILLTECRVSMNVQLTLVRGVMLVLASMLVVKRPLLNPRAQSLAFQLKWEKVVVKTKKENQMWTPTKMVAGGFSAAASMRAPSSVSIR